MERTESIMTDLNADPRWRKIHDEGFLCRSCSARHKGVFDLVADRPDVWTDGGAPAPNSAITEASHILTEDFCIVRGTDYLIRVVLEARILGVENARLGFGVWAHLPEMNFFTYLNTFDSGRQAEYGPWYGSLANSLPGYPPTLLMPVALMPLNGRIRPRVVLEATDHPLSVDQRDGITLDRLFDIYAAHGHDVRASLAAVQ